MEPEQPSLFELYHENSKITARTSTALRDRVLAFFGDRHLQRQIDGSYKTYGDPSAVPVSSSDLPVVPLGKLLRQRQSVTPASAAEHFGGGPVTIDALGTVLRAGYGEVRRRMVSVGPFEYSRGGRTVPSGGGLYPLELYAWSGTAATQGPSTTPGEVYHFHPVLHLLERTGIHVPSCLPWFPDLGYDTSLPPSIVVITGLHRRTTRKYGERGYRFLLLEAGHVMQNMLLAATALGVPSAPIGGFLDDVVAHALRLDPAQEYPLYCLFLASAQPQE